MLLGLVALLVTPAVPVAAAADPLADVAWPAPTVETLSGTDRVATAIAASAAGWSGGAAAAVLVSGQDYPDALSAAGLSGALGAPVLLTNPDRLDPRTTEELGRLGAQTVYVVGGPSAIGPEVVAALEEAGHTVERVAGATRYDTAFAVATLAVELGADPSRVLVASGERFADALSLSSLAAGLGHPILLVTAATDPSELAARVAELGGGHVLVAGGPAAVPDEPLAELESVERLAGRDRIETALVVAAAGRARGLDGPPAIASAESYPDGLAGGAYAGAARNGPLLLSARAELPRALMEWLAANQPAEVAKLGGNAAIGPLATCQLQGGHARPWGCIEGELHRQGYNVGALDGRIDHQSPWAVYAFQKVAGLPVDGNFREAEWGMLLQRPTVAPRRPDLPPDHLEVDLSRQLLLVYRGGTLAHAFHVSTGKPSTPTIRGTYSFFRKLDYRNASNMYKPIYFYPRYAIHGYPSVPLHAASAGCVRIFDGDQDFLWPKVPLGERIAIF